MAFSFHHRSEENSEKRIELISGSLDDPRLEQSIERKRLYTSSMSFKTEKEEEMHQLFEHFMIIGVPPNVDPNDPEPDPKILFIYPSSPLFFSEEDFNQTITFCFPDGIKKHGIEYKRKNIFISEFAFRLDSKTIYGICVHFIANPNRTPFFATEESLKYPFCFCILTRVPLLSVHFQYLTYMVLLYCRVLNPHSEREIHIVENDNDVTLSYLIKENGTARWPNTRYPDVLHDELAYFRQMERYTDRDNKYQLSDDMWLIIPPTNSSLRSIAMTSLDVLFSCLDISTIARLFEALLLEHHILFTSENLHSLTLSVLAARTLLNPFKIGASLLPIVPNTKKYLRLLGAPFPYIYGILSASAVKSLSLPLNVCIVDLDNGTVEDPLISEPLPRCSQLIDSIKKIISADLPLITVPQPYVTEKGKRVHNAKYQAFLDAVHGYMRPEKYLKTLPHLKYVFNPPLVDNILEAFSKHIAYRLERKIQPCFVTDSTDCEHPVTIFNKDLFLASLSKDSVPFYKNFIETQIFSQFCEGITDKMERTKRKFSLVGSISDDQSSPLSEAASQS